MSDFRCPRYYWDGNHWRCQNLPDDYLNVHDFDTYCTSKTRCLECPYMDSEVRERVRAYREEAEARQREAEEAEARQREYEESNRSNEDNSSSNNYEYREPSYTPSSGSSDDGCLMSLVGVVAIAIDTIVKKILWPIIKVYFLGFYLSMMASYTWFAFVGSGVAALLAFVGLIPITILFAVIVAVIWLLFFPYWVILMCQKIKKRMEWREVCSYYWKWFLKGPFAYVELADFLGRNNSMPRVTKIINNAIDSVKKLFAKKNK